MSIEGELRCGPFNTVTKRINCPTGKMINILVAGNQINISDESKNSIGGTIFIRDTALEVDIIDGNNNVIYSAKGESPSWRKDIPPNGQMFIRRLQYSLDLQHRP